MKKIYAYFKSCPLYIFLLFAGAHIVLTAHFYGINSYIVQDYSAKIWFEALFVTLVAVLFTCLVVSVIENIKSFKKQLNK